MRGKNNASEASEKYAFSCEKNGVRHWKITSGGKRGFPAGKMNLKPVGMSKITDEENPRQ
jgi:hypothetical protein